MSRMPDSKGRWEGEVPPSWRGSSRPQRDRRSTPPDGRGFGPLPKQEPAKWADEGKANVNKVESSGTPV